MNIISDTLRFAFLIAALLFSTISFSQNTIKGMVYDADNTNITLNAHIVLWHNDSVVAQCINAEKGFCLENILDGVYTLNISHIGYISKQMTLNIKKNLNLGNIPITYGYELDEIVVESTRNITSYKNNLLHVKVEQTYLQDLPNIESLLSNIPGIIQKDNKFSYFGKGKIQFLINGREVKSMEEINTLHPRLITEFIIDNMPSSKYESCYSSVINIKTISEKPALMIYHTGTWARQYSNVEGFTSQSNIKNTLLDFGYSFRRRKNTLYSKQIEENLYPDNIFKSSFTDTTFSNRISHDWHIGTQSNLKTGTLNLKYTGYCSLNSPIYNSHMKHANNNLQEDLDILQTAKYKELQHQATLDYKIEMTKEDILRITGDYLFQNTKDNGLTTEKSTIAEKQTNLDFQNTYHIYSLMAKYEHDFGNVIRISVGSRYSYVYSKNNSKENEILTLYNLYENRYALYIEGRIKWKKLLLQLGLRGEKFDKEYHRTAQIAIDYKKTLLLPSLSITYSPIENLQISFGGNNKVLLPSFNELTPITTYLNQHSYMIGNPLLKPTVRYDFSMGVTWMKKLNAMFEYNIVKNDRTAYTVPDENNALVFKHTYTNINKTQQFMGMLTYSDKLLKCHVFNISAGIIVPNVTIPYMGQYLHQSTPAYFTQLNYNLKIGKMVNFSANYLFQSKFYDKVETYSNTHNLKCNLSIVPNKSKLSLNIQINDILKRAIGNWDTNYGYIHTQQYNNPDSRNIMLSVRYTLNPIKSIKQINSNTEEINRL